MIEQDTVRLLHECSAGVKMGVQSIDEVLGAVRSPDLSRCLRHSRDEHRALDAEITRELARFGDDSGQPNPIAESMSWLKTSVKLAVNESDATVADLMTDGCNMGVKSLSGYLNRYEAADEHSKDLAKRLIHMETRLAADLRPYL